ncbi:GNAT family N-acetyltransferase [Ancylobacter pratisalsi]|uniref:GNAT family N-acetyltransferase n=1 Tax=Ancylobacter pratisalsi TaxID=1745854 RepID=A0A6P1YP67_9HYPH|nr:GNAT family N-acetyltransferase [Ancylobacter pratisalsi]QIB34882.1 GNAT family N-acetyltransferase [Ancylobacter pratisalsi]
MITAKTMPMSESAENCVARGAAPARSPHLEIVRPARHRPALGEGHIRKLLPAERHLLLEHFLRLDPLSRFMRFGGVISDSALSRHATRVTTGDALALGYFVDGELHAVAELHPLPKREGKPLSAEAAFSVERPWQGKGVGSAMMEHLVMLAQNRGIEELQVVFLPNNGRMKRLAVHGAADFSVDDEEVVGRMKAPHATVFSRMRELMGDVFSVCSSAFDLQERSLPPSLRGN